MGIRNVGGRSVVLAASSVVLFTSNIWADTLVWNNTNVSTSAPAQWDGTATNFNDVTTGTPNVPYTDGSAVQFDDSLRNGSQIVLQVGNVSAGGGVTPASVTFTHTAGGTTSYNLISNTSGSVGITGPTSLTLDSGFGGTVFLNNVNTFTGGINLNGGTLRAPTGGLPATTTVNLGGGNFLTPTGSTAPNYTATQNFVTVAGTTGSTFTLSANGSAAGVFSTSSGATVANTTLTFANPAFTMTQVNFSNSATATPTVSFAGRVNFGTSTGSFRVLNGSPNALFDLGTGSATLAINTAGTAVYLGGLAGGANTILAGPANGTAANTAFIIGSTNQATTFAGLINVGSKGRPLINIVGGALTLTNTAQTFSTTGSNTGAATTITGGALYLDNASGSGSGPSGINVNGGTLGGIGFTNGAVAATTTGIVTVNQTAATGFATGGRIAPGSAGSTTGSTVGTLTLSSGLTLNDYSNLDFTLSATSATAGAAGGNDLIATGALVAPTSGLVQVNFQFAGGSPLTGTAYDLINYTALTGDPSTWTASGLPAGYAAAFSTANNQVNVTFSQTGVPEPTTLGLLSLGGWLLGRRRRD